MRWFTDLIDRQAAIDEEGLDEEIRCEMCRNPMHTDRGCDGNCKYDEKLYEKIMQILDRRIKPLPSAQPDADAIRLQKEQAYMQGWEDGRASIVQSSLYGYNIAHLAVIAAVMEKEGVTPEKAAQICGDIQAVCQMVIDEIQERVAKAISSAQPKEDCDTCIHGYFGDSQCDNCRVGYPSHYERGTDETD